MSFSVTSLISPITKGFLLIWKEWKKPLSKDPDEEEIEILKCWVCSSHASPLRTETEKLVLMKRQAFECLSVLYKRGDEYGIVLFGGSHQTPQNNSNLILPKLLEEITAKDGWKSPLTVKKIQYMINENRFHLTECLYLNAIDSLIGMSWEWEPTCLFNHEYKTTSLNDKAKLSREIDLAVVSLRVIEIVKRGHNKNIPQSFCDRLLEAWGNDRENRIVKILKDKRLKLEKYEEPGWNFSQSPK